MGKSSEWFIKLKEQEQNGNVHVIYDTLKYEQDCDNSPNI